MPFADRNRHAQFTNAIEPELGYYVYGLFDPRDGKPFYIGKGGGERGNSRVLGHFDEARAALSSDSASTPKIARIIDIWQSGHEVDWKILRRKLASAGEAFAVEATIMDTLRASGIPLLNAQAGHGSTDIGRSERGLLECDDVYALGQPPLGLDDIPTVLKERRILLLNIGGPVRDNWRTFKEPRYREALKGPWKSHIVERANHCEVALGVVGKLIRCAFDLDGPTAVLVGKHERAPLSFRPQDHRLAPILDRPADLLLDAVRGQNQGTVLEIPRNGAVLVHERKPLNPKPSG